MKSKIKIASTGTGSTDGLASQLLCKLNAVMFASYFGYQYVDIPFDDCFIKGNSGHRYGEYSTALQNIIFSFPGFSKIHPLVDAYEKIKIIDIRDVMKKIKGLNETRIYINEEISLHSKNYDIFVLNGFSNLFADKTFLYNKISRGMNLIIDPLFLSRELIISDKFKICVHIRRGDILTHEVNHNRIIPVEYFNKVVDQVKEILNQQNIEYFINLHIEGDPDGFLHENNKFDDVNPIKSFFDFITADLVISSKSSHSSVPAMLSGKLMIYPNDTWMPSLPGWISADKDGKFDTNKFLNLLINYC